MLFQILYGGGLYTVPSDKIMIKIKHASNLKYAAPDTYREILDIFDEVSRTISLPKYARGNCKYVVVYVEGEAESRRKSGPDAIKGVRLD